MANIMITEHCNLHCPYCFVKDYTCSSEASNISYKNFERAVEFITNNGSSHLGIIGGEPLMHPDFENLMHSIIRNDKVKYVTIFTNGILLEKYIKILNHKKFKILINVNTPEDIGVDKFNMFKKGLNLLYKDALCEINFGVNIYDCDEQYDSLIDLCTMYNVQTLRVSLAVPPYTNTTHPLTYALQLKPSFLRLLQKLSTIEVTPYLDCYKIPECVFSIEERSFLKTFNSNLLATVECTPVIDITINLQVLQCFGTPKYSDVSIVNFDNLDDLNTYFCNKFKILRSKKVSTQCTICPISELCEGSCLAFKK